MWKISRQSWEMSSNSFAQLVKVWMELGLSFGRRPRIRVELASLLAVKVLARFKRSLENHSRDSYRRKLCLTLVSIPYQFNHGNKQFQADFNCTFIEHDCHN